MNSYISRVFRSRVSKLVAVVTVCLLTSSCILRITGGFVFTDDVSTFVRLVFDGVSVALCRDRTDEEGVTTNECRYHIETEDGFSQSTSTVELISNLGFFGLLVDPAIMQVPQGSVVEVATADDGTGPQPLRITETAVFDVQPGVQVPAQAGHVFWIIELPELIEQGLAAAPAELDFAFDLNVPHPPAADGRIPIKLLLTGRVEVNGDTFYVPLWPCTTDMAEVPEIRIPVTPDLFGFIFDLLFQFGEEFGNPNRSCMDEVYDFTSGPGEPPPIPVTDLTARAKRGKVQVVWTHVGADSYNVYRSDSMGGPYDLIDSTASTYSTYADTGLANGTTYYYVVTSVLGGTESIQSNEVAATPMSRRRRR